MRESGTHPHHRPSFALHKIERPLRRLVTQDTRGHPAMMQAAMAVVLTSGNVSPDDPITIETTAVAELRLV